MGGCVSARPSNPKIQSHKAQNPHKHSKHIHAYLQQKNHRHHNTISEKQMNHLIDQLFNEYDTDHDDALTPSQIKNMMNKLYEKTNQEKRHVTDEQIDRFVDNLHRANQEKLVTRQEFHMFFKQDYV